MIKREIIEAALVDMAHMQGHTLNGQDLLQLRTRIATGWPPKNGTGSG